MTIAEIIRRGKGTAHAWRVVSDNPPDPYSPWVYSTLWHYSTPMLEWRTHRRTGEHQIIMAGTGYGSVSDQNGMNIAFRVLDLPLYYSRAGGNAEIIDITDRLRAAGYNPKPLPPYRTRTATPPNDWSKLDWSLVEGLEWLRNNK